MSKEKMVFFKRYGVFCFVFFFALIVFLLCWNKILNHSEITDSKVYYVTQLRHQVRHRLLTLLSSIDRITNKQSVTSFCVFIYSFCVYCWQIVFTLVTCWNCLFVTKYKSKLINKEINESDADYWAISLKFTW